MFNFLRRLRFSQLTNDKAGRYVLYALGEITLVVIGILIALQINNWNEGQKDRQQEIIFLSDFRSDLSKDVEILSDYIFRNERSIEGADIILSFLKSGKSKLSENELRTFYNEIYRLSGEFYFIPEKSTINQFQAGNNNRLISSKDLKDKIFRYYANADRKENNSEKSVQLYQHSDITLGVFKPMMGGDLLEVVFGNSFGRPDLNLKDLTQNTDFLFSVIAKRIITINQNFSYEERVAEANEIITLLDTELNSDL